MTARHLHRLRTHRIATPTTRLAWHPPPDLPMMARAGCRRVAVVDSLAHGLDNPVRTAASINQPMTTIGSPGARFIAAHVQ